MVRLHLGWLALAWALVHATAGAEGFPPAVQSTPTQLHPAVRLEQRRYAQPRPLRVWLATIDLTCPELEFVLTPKARVEPPFETRSQTTLAFAQQMRTLVAINGSPFAPNHFRAGQPTQIDGLHLVHGNVISPPEPHFPSLVLDALNRPEPLPRGATAADAARSHNGLGGFIYVLAAGRSTQADEQNPAKEPRTAIGLSADRKTMVWLIVDGRQPGVSEGVTQAELAELGRGAGCADVLNLDGGGSTTLVAFDAAKKEQRVQNTPVGIKLPGTQRPNGNNLGLRVWTKANGVTLAQLRQIMPTAPEERLRRFVAPLNAAMAEFEIDTAVRRAAFLAQIAHETASLKYMEEIADGTAYEGRKDLGNTKPGDGPRFKGRGPIQLTGRANYQAAGRALELDLELKPELAAGPEVGCRVAGWYWKSRKLNVLADGRDFTALTKKINGGLNGLASRQTYWQRALEALGKE